LTPISIEPPAKSSGTVHPAERSILPRERGEFSRKERNSMNVIVDLTVVPIGAGTSLSAYVAACEQILADAGLKHVLHANGTDVEGEWDSVFAAIKRCHETVHRMGAPRVFTVIKAGTRTDREQTMQDKIASVEARSKKPA
jgi:uncharacterized protein (TIGR00106 family)